MPIAGSLRDVVETDLHDPRTARRRLQPAPPEGVMPAGSAIWSSSVRLLAFSRFMTWER
jgi:hypothetical protein